eukprot:1144237-Pelagomonas_calceolata.AAC.2
MASFLLDAAPAPPNNRVSKQPALFLDPMYHPASFIGGVVSAEPLLAGGQDAGDAAVCCFVASLACIVNVPQINSSLNGQSWDNVHLEKLLSDDLSYSTCCCTRASECATERALCARNGLLRLTTSFLAGTNGPGTLVSRGPKPDKVRMTQSPAKALTLVYALSELNCNQFDQGLHCRLERLCNDWLGMLCTMLYLLLCLAAMCFTCYACSLLHPGDCQLCCRSARDLMVSSWEADRKANCAALRVLPRIPLSYLCTPAQ